MCTEDCMGYMQMLCVWWRTHTFCCNIRVWEVLLHQYQRMPLLLTYSWVTNLSIKIIHKQKKNSNNYNLLLQLNSQIINPGYVIELKVIECHCIYSHSGIPV
jgi:hypothetical protein